MSNITALFAKDALHTKLYTKVLEAVENKTLVLHEKLLNPKLWTLLQHDGGYLFVNVFGCDEGFDFLDDGIDEHEYELEEPIEFNFEILGKVEHNFVEMQLIIKNALEALNVPYLDDDGFYDDKDSLVRYIRFSSDENLCNQFVEVWGDEDNNRTFPLIGSREDIKNFIINADDEEYMEKLDDEDYLNNVDTEFWIGGIVFEIEKDKTISWTYIGECMYYEDEYRAIHQNNMEFDDIEHNYHHIINAVLLGNFFLI